MTTTTNLGITLVEQAQSQKEVTINEAFARIDALLNTGAISITNTPPGSPATGDLYIVGTAPTGAWAGQANTMVYFDQIWRFIPPRAGMQLYMRSASQFYLFSGTSWGGISGSGTFSSGINVGNTAQSSPTTLDWYEEGTFTPVLYGFTTAGAGTYSLQVGKYTRIGNRVDVYIALQWTAHTGTGEGRISGIPYTNTGYAVPCHALNVSYSVSAGAVLAPYIEAGASFIRLGDVATSSGTLSFPNLDTSAQLYLSFTYFL